MTKKKSEKKKENIYKKGKNEEKKIWKKYGEKTLIGRNPLLPVMRARTWGNPPTGNVICGQNTRKKGGNPNFQSCAMTHFVLLL